MVRTTGHDPSVPPVPRDPGGMSEREPEDTEADDEVEEIIEELAEHPDAPEADVIEQHQAVVPESHPAPHLGAEIPEADALEQAIPVEGDDEYPDE